MCGLDILGLASILNEILLKWVFLFEKQKLFNADKCAFKWIAIASAKLIILLSPYI